MATPKTRIRIIKLLLLGALFITAFTGALFLAQYVATHESAQAIVTSMGYTGVLAIAFLSGISAVSPIPPGAFVPLFTAAGLHLPIIIATLIIGTTIADIVGYLFGKWGKSLVSQHYPNTHKKIEKLNIKNARVLFAFVFLYATFMPLPNEVFLIPLALMGIPLRRFMLPLVLGTTIYHTAGAYGAQTLFQLFF